MEPLESFFREYWAWGPVEYHLIGLGVLFLIIAGIFRRPAIAVGVVVFGLYLSLAAFLVKTYAHHGFTMEWALATVIGGGLVVAIGVYYAIFVRN